MEPETLELSDFYFTGDDYRYRFGPEARQKFIDLIRERFNAGVAYKGRMLKWDTIIEQKTVELGKALVKNSAVDFLEPRPILTAHETNELSGRILSLTQSEANDLGIGKSTLHYLRANAKRGRIKIYAKVRAKLEAASITR